MNFDEIMASNRRWAEAIREQDPEFFGRLVGQQRPHCLWVGCSDSRVPASQILGLAPGEVFVHRNVANLVHHTDMNCLSVVQFALNALGVSEVIVCGHYGCGGVIAALRAQGSGLIENWINGIREDYKKYLRDTDLHLTETEVERVMCELNVIRQVYNLAHTPVVRQAWQDGRVFRLHGVIYDLNDGVLNDLGVSMEKEHVHRDLDALIAQHLQRFHPAGG